MAEKFDILDLLRRKGAEAERLAHSGMIIQPGAFGDCLLTLPLAKFMKEKLNLGSVEILGRSEYIGILPGKSCIDGIRSIDSFQLHRMFVSIDSFDILDHDPLINLFASYCWIASFLGEPGSNFEQNLIFTANCSHSAEIITLPLKPPEDSQSHIAEFYIRQFIRETNLELEPGTFHRDEILIKATKSDVKTGKKMLQEIEIDPVERIAVIHPGSGSRKKSWHLDNFIALAEQLKKQDFVPVFLLGPAEREKFTSSEMKKIYSCAKTMTDIALPQVLSLLACSDTFIGNDSGITHLAAGLGINTIAVFRSSDPRVYSPIGPKVNVFNLSPGGTAEKSSRELRQKVLKAVNRNF